MTIPKIIFQTCSFKKDQIPDYIKVNVDTWIDKNPTWEYRYYDDDDCSTFVKEYFPDLYKMFSSIKVPFARADFWRFLALYEFGGVYADIDTFCVNPLDDWLDINKDFISAENYIIGLGYNIEDWFFANSTKNIVSKNIVDYMINRIKNSHNDDNYYVSPWHTNPYMFTEAIQEKMPNENILIMNSNFNENVIHLNGSNRWGDSQENKKLLHTHYWNKTKNIDLKINTNGYGSGVLKQWE